MMRSHYTRLIALCLACFISACAPTEPSNPFKGKNTAMPVLSLTDANEVPVSLATGTWRIINLWATWCAPCVKELPDLDILAQELAPLGAEVVIIAVNTPRDDARTLLDSLGIQHVRELYDANNTVMGAFKPRGIPTTYLVDPSGTIIGVAEGFKVWTTPEKLNWLRQTLQRVGTGTSPE